MPDSEERRVDLEGRARVVALELRYRRAARRLTAMVAVLVLTGVAVTGATAVLIAANRDRAQEAKATAARIQIERARSIGASCTETNRRHRVGITVAAGDPTVVRLVNALAPVRDCDALVRSSVGR